VQPSAPPATVLWNKVLPNKSPITCAAKRLLPTLIEPLQRVAFQVANRPHDPALGNIHQFLPPKPVPGEQVPETRLPGITHLRQGLLRGNNRRAKSGA